MNKIMVATTLAVSGVIAWFALRTFGSKKSNSVADTVKEPRKRHVTDVFSQAKEGLLDMPKA